MTVAALDLGTRRIGVAIGDPEGRFVHPLTIIERRSLSDDIESIRRILVSREVDRVIVGLPLNMDGTEGKMARSARSFANRLEEATGVAVELQDERLSSFEARERMGVMPAGRGKKKRQIDAIAAAVILETWFDAKNRRLPPSG